MTELRHIPIENIRRRGDARPRTDEALIALSESINAVGLINPIRVRQIGEWFEVTAGSHRLQACDLLSWKVIPCLIVNDDDLHAELAMIDENLCRAELSPADRAKQIARRKAIYLELHPETAAGRAQATGMNRSLGNNVSENFAPTFTAETAKLSGQSARTVQLHAERGEKVIDEVIDLIRGTKLDTGTYLDKLKGLRPNEQATAAKRDLNFIRQQSGNATRLQQPDVKPDPIKSAEQFISLADQIDAIPSSELVASGRLRATVGQRAEGLAVRMDEIKELLDR